MPQEKDFEYKTETITRALQIESSNSEDRTVEISFSTEAPDDKGSYLEILSHEPNDVDLSWGNSTWAPCLLEHDPEKHIGVIERCWIDTIERKGRAVVRLATDEKSEQAWIKIKDRVLVNTSVRAKVTSYTVDKEAEKPIVRCAWALQEISFVSIPQDKNCGIARSEKNSDLDKTKSETEPTVIGSVVNPEKVPQEIEIERSSVSENKKVVDIQITKQNQLQNNKGNKMTTENLNQDDIIRAERARADEIAALGDQFKQHDLARSAIQAGKSVDIFRSELLQALQNKQRVDTSIGLTNQEAKDFSIARAMQAIATGDFSEAGYEMEVSRAYAKASGKAQKTSNIYIPDEVIMKAAGANATTTGTAGAVGLKTRGAWIEALRAKTIAGRLGVQMVGGLSGALELPRFLSLPEARFVNEGADGTVDAITAGVVTLVPRSVIALVELTRSMVNNLPSIESQLNQELLAAISTRIDQEVFTTVLADGDIDFVAAPASGVDYAQIRALVTKLSNADVNTDMAKWAMNGSVEGYLSSTLKSANTAAMYLRGDDGRVAGLASEFSRTVGGDHLLIGDWSKVTVASWGGIELAADSSTKFTSGGTVLRAIADVDVGVTVPAAVTGYKSLVV